MKRLLGRTQSTSKEPHPLADKPPGTAMMFWEIYDQESNAGFLCNTEAEALEIIREDARYSPHEKPLLLLQFVVTKLDYKAASFQKA